MEKKAAIGANNPLTMLQQQTERMIERQKLEEEFDKNATILIQQKKLLRIDQFTGYFEFLHNNYLTPVYYEEMLYPSVTHAYHAARSSDDTTRKAIVNAESFHVVAKIARRIEDPPNWSMKRLKIMEQLVRDKFRRSKELQEKLKATERRELIMSYEEETPGNLFWGMIREKGQNQLGRILTKVREDILNSNEVINWITSSFDILKDVVFLPEISLTVNKENKTIDHIVLKNKPIYKFGVMDTNDVVLDHPSISRLHSMIICDKNLGVVLVDLRSKSGTKLNNEAIRDHIPYKLQNGSKINFALSSRDYIVNIDLTKIEKVYEKEKMKLEEELKLLKNLENVETTKGEKEITIKKTFGIIDNENNDTVFISNIPSHANEIELKKLFEEQFGEIKSINWPNDRDTGFKKPFAFIRFISKDSAKEAVDYGIMGYASNDDNNYDDFELEEKNKNIFMKIRYAENYNKRESNNNIDKKDYEEKIKKELKERRRSRERKQKHSSKPRSKSRKKKTNNKTENEKRRMKSLKNKKIKKDQILQVQIHLNLRPRHHILHLLMIQILLHFQLILLH